MGRYGASCKSLFAPLEWVRAKTLRNEAVGKLVCALLSDAVVEPRGKVRFAIEFCFLLFLEENKISLFPLKV